MENVDLHATHFFIHDYLGGDDLAPFGSILQ